MDRNTFVVLEQLPGYAMYRDETPKLLAQGYQASYNAYSFPEMQVLSNISAIIAMHGSWFNYSLTPRWAGDAARRR